MYVKTIAKRLLCYTAIATNDIKKGGLRANSLDLEAGGSKENEEDQGCTYTNFVLP